MLRPPGPPLTVGPLLLQWAWSCRGPRCPHPIPPTPPTPRLVSVLKGTTHTPPSATPLPRQASSAQLPLVPRLGPQAEPGQQGLTRAGGASGGRSSSPPGTPGERHLLLSTLSRGGARSHWAVLSSTPRLPRPRWGPARSLETKPCVAPSPHPGQGGGEHQAPHWPGRGQPVPRPFSQESGSSCCLMAGRLLPSLGHLASGHGLSLEPVVTLLLPRVWHTCHLTPRLWVGARGSASTFHRGQH